MRVIITGATGFIGRRACMVLSGNSHDVFGCVINSEEKALLPDKISALVVGEIAGETNWRKYLAQGDTIVHLAARVHIMHESALNPIAEFRRVNTAGTINLARQAAAAGAKRLVFMSTIGVNGNDSGSNFYTESDVPQPHNDYSVSKYEAEMELRKVAAETGLEVVILRAPLVYGPGNPGNFLSLLRFLRKAIPLPLASVHNVKSFLYVGNLVDAIKICAVHPAAAGNTYLVSDTEYISTPDLLRKLAQAMGVTARLFPFPPALLKFLAGIAGKSAAVERLTASLAVDSSKIRKELGWCPPFTLNDGIQATADWYKSL